MKGKIILVLDFYVRWFLGHSSDKLLFCSSKIIPNIISVPDILRYFNKNFGMNVGCQNFPGSANREESAGFWNIWNA